MRLADRMQRLIDRLLCPLEEEWFGAAANGAVIPRVKALRMKIMPDMVQGRLDDAERQRRWRQLADIYLAQQISNYPPEYLTTLSVDRLLETIERFEEDLTDRVRVHGHLKAVMEVGPPIVVSPQRERHAAVDPLMVEIERQLQQMLDRLAIESPLYRAPRRGLAGDRVALNSPHLVPILRVVLPPMGMLAGAPSRVPHHPPLRRDVRFTGHSEGVAVVVSLVFVVGMLNLVVGFALAIALERWFVLYLPTWRRDSSTAALAALTVERPLSRDPDRDLLLGQVPDKWAAWLEQANTEFHSFVEASVHALRLEVSTYRNDLLDVEDLVRSAVATNDADAIRDAVEKLVALNEEWVVAQTDAARVMEEKREVLGAHAALGNQLTNLLVNQAQEIEEPLPDHRVARSEARRRCRDQHRPGAGAVGTSGRSAARRDSRRSGRDRHLRKPAGNLRPPAARRPGHRPPEPSGSGTPVHQVVARR